MKWHIAYRHETPAAFDALGKDYESKITNLQEENALLKKKLEQLDGELHKTQITLIQEKAENTEKTAQVLKLNNDIQKMVTMIAVRDSLIKERLNIEMPNPFK